MVNNIRHCVYLFSMMFVFVFSNMVYSATYYIDFDGGSDTNAGTSEGTAWKTIPGTRNTADSDDESTCWGSGCPGSPTIDSSNKVQAGDVFRIKPGTTHDSSDGGKILIDSDYYATDATVENPIKFVAYQAWSGANGSITLDGTGITLGGTGQGLVRIDEMGGIEWDGETVNGFIIQDSYYMGISNYVTGNIEEGCTFKYIKFVNNGTGYVGDQAAAAQLHLRWPDGGSIEHCEFDGNNNSINGVTLGESGQRAVDFTISDCTAYDHYGTNDGGIGFKAQNSTVVFNNVTSYNNYKGFDCGEDSGNSSWNIIYKYINILAYDNTNCGANFSGPESSWSGEISFYYINAIIRDNGEAGAKVYAGPYNLYIVHSVFDNNQRNILIHPNGIDDTYTMRVYVYNSIFYKPTNSDGNVVNGYWLDSGLDWVLDSDYNSYIQNSSEYFSKFGAYGGGSDVHTFSYGSNGPGHSSGTWYSFQSWNNDPNSKGTGASDTTDPSFTDINNHVYTLTESYAGTDISGKGWYTLEMGTDRNGVTRTAWDIGAYEYQSYLGNVLRGGSMSGGSKR